MKAYSSNEIKQELLTLPPKRLVELCLRLARFKKENKELLSFQLFESENEHGYVEGIKIEIDEAFAELPKPNWFHTKKGLRKILRLISRYSKYTTQKESELEMRLHFCKHMKNSKGGYLKNVAIANIYKMQLKKVAALVEVVHEDLQYDYSKQLEELQ